MNEELKVGFKKIYVIGIFKVLLMSLAWLWLCGALRYLMGVPSFLSFVILIGLPIYFYKSKKRRKHLLILSTVLLLISVVLLIIKKPKRYSDWDVSCKKPPIIRISESGDIVTVSNVRHFKWVGVTDYQPSWVKKNYYLDKLDSLDLIVEPLADSRLFAHTMLSFGFGPEERVVISVEARKEKGEKYGLISGLYKQFELLYQISSERDALTLRVARGQSKLYLYPVKATPEFIKSLFLDMVSKAGSLVDNPAFYHSLRANCTTELFKHIRENFDGDISYGKGVLFPSTSGHVLHEMGWMDTELDYEEARKKFMSAERVRMFSKDPHFSRKIRGNDTES